MVSCSGVTFFLYASFVTTTVPRRPPLLRRSHHCPLPFPPKIRLDLGCSELSPSLSPFLSDRPVAWSVPGRIPRIGIPVVGLALAALHRAPIFGQRVGFRRRNTLCRHRGCPGPPPIVHDLPPLHARRDPGRALLTIPPGRCRPLGSFSFRLLAVPSPFKTFAPLLMALVFVFLPVFLLVRLPLLWIAHLRGNQMCGTQTSLTCSRYDTHL